MLKALYEESVEWCQGRIWYLRLIVLIFFGYIFIKHLDSATYQSIFKPLNLGIHELGHYLFAFLGRFMEMAGGSITQCLAPVVSMMMFLRLQRDFFAIAFCFGWLATNFFDVAVYAADARLMQLPLVRPGGGEVIHDWNYLLGRMGLLEWDGTIAFLFSAGGVVAMIICLAGGGWLVWNMITSGRNRE
jgi:hypothetical protein